VFSEADLSHTPTHTHRSEDPPMPDHSHSYVSEAVLEDGGAEGGREGGVGHVELTTVAVTPTTAVTPPRGLLLKTKSEEVEEEEAMGGGDSSPSRR